MKITRLMVSLLLCVICATTIMSQVSRSNGKMMKVDGFGEDSIQFLILKVSDLDGVEQVELVRSMIKPGYLKKEIDISLHHDSGGYPFVFSLLDNKDKVLKSIEFPHPLREYVEYVDDLGALQKKEVVSKAKEFLIRVPYRRVNAMLKLEKITTVMKKGAAGGKIKESIGVISITKF